MLRPKEKQGRESGEGERWEMYLIKTPNFLQFLRKRTQNNEKTHSQQGNSSVRLSVTKTT